MLRTRLKILKMHSHQSPKKGVPSTENAQAPKFTRCGTQMIHNWHLPLELRFLLMALRSFCYGKKRECFPSAELLAKICGRKSRTIFRWAKQLEKIGYLKRRPSIPGNKKSPTIYTLLDVEEEIRLQKLADPKRSLVSPMSPKLVSPMSHEEDNVQREVRSTTTLSETPGNVIPMTAAQNPVIYPKPKRGQKKAE